MKINRKSGKIDFYLYFLPNEQGEDDFNFSGMLDQIFGPIYFRAVVPNLFHLATPFQNMT